MLRLFLVSVSFFLSIAAGAQQFSFQMIFRDAIGNLDTVKLGYDDNATNEIDASFGEKNILSSPYKNGIDARASNIWWKHQAAIQPHLQGKSYFVDAFINAPKIQTEVQIVKNTHSCQLGSIWKGPFNQIVPIIELNIRTDNWPVTAYWNSSEFADPCRNGSVMTSMHPGAWWDGGFNQLVSEFVKADSVTFHESKYHIPTDSGAIPLPVYWIAFGDSSLSFDDAEMEWLLSVPEIEKATASLFPNPSDNSITVTTHGNFGAIKEVRIYSPMGRLVKASDKTVIDISALDAGIYFAEVISKDGSRAASRFIKR